MKFTSGIVPILAAASVVGSASAFSLTRQRKSVLSSPRSTGPLFDVVNESVSADSSADEPTTAATATLEEQQQEQQQDEESTVEDSINTITAAVEETEEEEEPKVAETAVAAIATTDAAAVVEPASSVVTTTTSETNTSEEFIDVVKDRFGILRQTMKEGYTFKQGMASAIAGEYDPEPIRAMVEETIQNNPCVMFTWDASPSCKDAVKAFEMMDETVDVTNIRLDNPWSEGNPIRAEIGKMVGRSSVPMIFIGGKYVGGYDGGISDDAPGILKLAFTGKLLPMLKEAGALKDKEEESE